MLSHRSTVALGGPSSTNPEISERCNLAQPGLTNLDNPQRFADLFASSPQQEEDAYPVLLPCSPPVYLVAPALGRQSPQPWQPDRSPCSPPAYLVAPATHFRCISLVAV